MSRKTATALLASAASVVAMLITGEDALTKGNNSFRTIYTKSHRMAQHLAVSHLAHAAEHGNPNTLNDFYAILATNDQTALRNYVRRIHAVLGGWDGITPVTSEEMSAYVEKGSFLGFSKGKFKVLPNAENKHAGAAKAAFPNLAVSLMNPDGKVWKPFLDRNNFAEIKLMGDADVLKQLDTIIGKAAGEQDNIDSQVSPAVIDKLKSLRTDLASVTPANVQAA